MTPQSQPQRLGTNVRDWQAAIRLADAYQRMGRNGAFYEIEGGYRVEWDVRSIAV